MKHARPFAFLLCMLFLSSVCLTFSVASASEAFYSAIPVPAEQNGILTTEDGQKWYKVKRFEDDADYILSVRNDAGEQKLLAVTGDAGAQYIWRFTRYSMTASDVPRVSELSSGRYALACWKGKLYTTYSGSENGDMVWDHDEQVLRYRCGDTVSYLKYHDGSDEPFTVTDSKADASAFTIYSRAATLERCITRQPAAASYVTEGSGYPAPEFSVGLSDVTADSISWFVDGQEQSCSAPTFTADILADRPSGVHRVSCLVAAHDSDNVYYREQSAEAAFVIAKGVMPDSFLTFSDVHEEYNLITDAIEQIMQQTNGLIPSLVICSGDLVNGPTAYRETELSRYYPQIVSHLGGLDTVFVAGNHDSAEAASFMSAAAGLGADANLPAKGGLIFDGESEAVAANGTNSRYAKGIITYGINYAAAQKETAGGIRYSYEDIISDVDSFLKTAAENYHGELIVISAHSGLHVIGLQPQSVNGYQMRLSGWLGENMYNVDMSFELAQTINRYAEQYNMDIMYIFGHDHSRNETEMFLTDGDLLISPKQYADWSTDSQTLHFTYANAGYLSTVIGSANQNYSFVFRDGDHFSHNLLHTDGTLLRHREIKAKHPYEEPLPETTAAPAQTTTADTAVRTTASVQKASAPETGDSLPVLLLAVPALAVLAAGARRRMKDA